MPVEMVQRPCNTYKGVGGLGTASVEMKDTITETVHLFKRANTLQTFFYTFTLLLYRFGLG